MEVFLGVIAGIILSTIFFIICFHWFDKSHPLNADFKKSQSKVLEDLKEKKDNFDKEITQEQLIKKQALQEELKRLDIDYQKKADDYKDKIEELEEDYQCRRDNLKELDAAAEAQRGIEQKEKIEQELERYNSTLNRLSEDYKEKKEKIEQDFFAYSEQVQIKREALTKEIEDYEHKQKEIIARFKQDEEKRQQADFYRVKINDVEKKDIVQLKQLALNFSKPNVIYKLLYEVYYKTKIEELFKRVLGDKATKGGIYKITNISNQKIYIGRTTKYIDRWRTHAKRGCNIDRINGQLYDAMFEEGLENFTWEIVEVCPKEEQSEKEKYWISFYKSDEYGYNGNKGG